MPTVPACPSASTVLNDTDLLWLTQGTGSTRDRKLSIAGLLAHIRNVVNVWREANTFEKVVGESVADIGNTTGVSVPIYTLNENSRAHLRNAGFAYIYGTLAGKPPMNFTIYTDPPTYPALFANNIDVPVYTGLVGGSLTRREANTSFNFPACSVVQLHWNGTYMVALGMSAGITP